MALTTPQPNAIDLLAQLGRYWSSRTCVTGGLSFCEPDASSASAIYARPLPDLPNREATACSLTIGPATVPTTNDPSTHIGIVAEVHGPKQNDVLAILCDLSVAIRSDDRRPFAHSNPNTTGTFDGGGVIGPPVGDAIGSQLGVWRVRRIDPISTPQIVAPLPGAAGTPGGQVSATMTMQTTCVPAVMPAAPLAMSLSVSSLVSDASARVVDGTLLLSWIDGGILDTASFDLTGAPHATINDVVVAIDALDAWSAVAGGSAGISARASLDLIDGFQHTEASGSGPIEIYAWA